MGSPAIRVLIADSRALYACALEAVLAAEPDMEVVAVLGGDAELGAASAAARPDVALVDLDTPRGDRPAACRRLGGLPAGCRTIAMSIGPLPGPLLTEIRSSVSGLVSKHSPTRVLVDAVREVNAGREVLDPRFTPAVRSGRADALTGRELELLTRAADGSSIRELSAQLLLSEGTVRNYLSRVGAKLGARNRIEAIRIVREAGWI